MACLFCRNFQAIEPEEPKKQREARQCQPNCGKDWDFHTAIRLYKDHPEYRETLKGYCHLNPQPLERTARYVCAQIDIPEYLHNGWHIPRRDEYEHRHRSLFDWAGVALGALCSKSWEVRQREILERQNKDLRRQLNAVRKISASRLARLQKEPKKEKPKQQEPKPLPESIMQLVAAE